EDWSGHDAMGRRGRNAVFRADRSRLPYQSAAVVGSELGGMAEVRSFPAGMVRGSAGAPISEDPSPERFCPRPLAEPGSPTRKLARRALRRPIAGDGPRRCGYSPGPGGGRLQFRCPQDLASAHTGLGTLARAVRMEEPAQSVWPTQPPPARLDQYSPQ